MAIGRFLIWKQAYAPNGWYRPSLRGHTNDVTEAGRFTEEYARGREEASNGDLKAIEYGTEEMSDLLKHFDETAWKLYQLATKQKRRCAACKEFAETAEGYPAEMVEELLGKNFCMGYEMSCDRDDSRFCFMPPDAEE